MPDEWEQHRDKYKTRTDTFEAYVDVWTRLEETRQRFSSFAAFARAANAQPATVQRQPERVSDAERLMRAGGYEIGEPTKRGARQWQRVDEPEAGSESPDPETDLESQREAGPKPSPERVGATGRIVLFGATGFTGRLVAAALVERGHRPVLAGRREDALTELADQHGDLEVATADADEPDSIRSLVEAGDVLVTTVGPFSIHGRAALDAAVDAGAHYVDSTGEPSFIRHVMHTAGPLAEQSGSALVPAAGYDFVPGHVAAALAYEAAGSSVRELRILYCASGGGLSTGTRASARLISLESTHRLANGRIAERPMGRDLLSVRVDGRTRRATLMGGTEPLAATHEWPGVESVSVWLDMGPGAWLAKGASFLLPAVTMFPAVDQRLREIGETTGGGPDATERSASASTVTAIAYDGSGRELARGWVIGPNPYDITATTMAAITSELAKHGAPRSGALGPLELFGLLDPHETAARLGLDST